MTITDHTAPGESAAASSRRLTRWPLVGTLAALLGIVATGFDSRVGEPRNPDYTVTAADLADLDSSIMRIGGFVGYLAVVALLVFAALWHRNVTQRFTGSIGASIVQQGLVASAATLTLAYGWKGALGNYGPGAMEAGTYDEFGLYAYYIVNDFGPFFAWLPVLVSLGGLAWMAFAERLVSRAMGALAAFFFFAALLAVALTGVPGLPVAASLGLVITTVWIAVGRSPISGDAR